MKKYKLLNESLKALKDKSINLLVLKGLAGFGKSHTTLEYLKKEKVNYKYINTYSTPLAFYQLLYKNRNKQIIVFDDLLGINNPMIMSMIKAVCWVSDNNKRIVNYHSTSPILKEQNLKNEFEFEGGIVLIFNNAFSGFEPILDRGVTIDFDFTYKEKLEILKNFQKDAKIDDEVLKYIKDNCTPATVNLSIRTAVILSNIKRAKHDFKIFADEMLKTNNEIKSLLEMSEKDWCKETGKSHSTYYRSRRKIK